MDTKFKSSSFATYSQYIASPIIICIFMYYVYAISIGKHLTQDELFFIPFWIWASIVVIINIIKLRNVTVSENGILMKSLVAKNILLYKDIEWINQNIFGSSWYIISIKYKNTETGKSNIIFILPEQYTSRESWSILNPFVELNITKYIREQIIKANPSYQIQNEPSRWYLAKWIFLSILPFLVISFFLIK